MRVSRSRSSCGLHGRKRINPSAPPPPKTIFPNLRPQRRARRRPHANSPFAHSSNRTYWSASRRHSNCHWCGQPCHCSYVLRCRDSYAQLPRWSRWHDTPHWSYEQSSCLWHGPPCRYSSGPLCHDDYELLSRFFLRKFPRKERWLKKRGVLRGIS
jgi:hypothetical protein